MSVFYSAFGIPLSGGELGEPFDGPQTAERLIPLLDAEKLLPAPPLSPAYHHADQRFRKAAYRYLRPEDRLPTYDDLPDRERVIAKVRLFHPLTDLVYYVVAVTDYSGQLVVTGYQIRRSETSFGDSSIAELTGLYLPLPMERDLEFEGRLLSEIVAR